MPDFIGTDEWLKPRLPYLAENQNDARAPGGYGVMNASGYRTIWDRKRQRMRQEHKVVWETYHGRPQPTGTHIHHMNHNKLDNRVSNLILVTHEIHKRLHSGCYIERGVWMKPCCRCKTVYPLKQFAWKATMHCYDSYCSDCTSQKRMRVYASDKLKLFARRKPSPHRGVQHIWRHNKWLAFLQREGRVIYRGTFATADEAIAAYVKAEAEYEAAGGKPARKRKCDVLAKQTAYYGSGSDTKKIAASGDRIHHAASSIIDAMQQMRETHEAISNTTYA